MTENKVTVLSDSKAARWTALVLLALAMFFGYIFMDVLSPLQSTLQELRGWDPNAYGHYAGSETFLNVFIFFLIFAGIILDKMGVRFTAVLSGAVMAIGALINYFALTDMFIGSAFEEYMQTSFNLPDAWWNVTPFYDGMPASAKLSAIGFMIFGCGVEMAGITVSRSIVKWFAGKEMALAMGTEMALARVGVFVVFISSPWISSFGGDLSVSRPVGLAALLLIVGLISFIVYFFMDRKLETQIGDTEEKDEPFKISDLRYILSSQVFWLVALLCVLYYSAIFPFQKYAANMLQCTLGISNEAAGLIFAVFPLGAAAITPILGNYLDRKGKGASMLILGAILMIICHSTFAFALPALRGDDLAKAEENTIITAEITQLSSGGDPIKAEVVFTPDHFTNKKSAQELVGMSVGEIKTINPWDAFTKQGVDPKKTAQKLVRFFATDKVDYAKAMDLRGDFSVKILKLSAPSGFIGMFVAFLAIIILGISFALVPASLWPSVPKLVDKKLIGSAYAVIFWIQNIGLYALPMLIGSVLVATNPGVNNPLNYDYTWPMTLFASLGVLALIIGLWLKALNAKRHYGLEDPNIKSQDNEVEFDGLE